MCYQRGDGDGKVGFELFRLASCPQRIVAVNRMLELQREDQIQISAGAAHKRTATLCRWHLNTRIETTGFCVSLGAAVSSFRRNRPQEHLVHTQASPRS